MSTKTDGGQAYPLSYEGMKTMGNPTGRHADRGMSLRDYFAGQALQGSLAGEPGSHLIPHNLAKDAYAFADAMLAERAK